MTTSETPSPRGHSANQAREVHSRLTKPAEWCGFTRLSDLSAADVQGAVADHRDEEDTAPRICNHYLKSAKSFSKWLKNDGRIAEHVLERLALLRTESERPAHPLTPEQLAALFAAAAAGEPRG